MSEHAGIYVTGCTGLLSVLQFVAGFIPPAYRPCGRVGNAA